MQRAQDGLFRGASSHRVKFRTLALILIVIAIPISFAGDGIFAFFTDDDLLNLYGHWTVSWHDLLVANLKYCSPVYRPFGGLFYRSVFALSGFDPLPFRIACFALMFANLWLLYMNARRLTGAAEIGLLSTLVACYHVGFTDLYYNTGTIYDLLCFSFYFLALLIYMTRRLDGHYLSVGRAVAIAILYICALNSKEMAVTFPLTVMVVEVVYCRPNLDRTGISQWLTRAVLFVLFLAMLTVPYVQAKLSAESPFPRVPDYIPHISLSQYVNTYGRYLDRIFYAPSGFFTPVREALLLVIMAALAWVFRSKALLFSTIFVIISILPVVFITPRGTIFVLYITFFGWALYAATLIAAVRRTILRARRDDHLAAQAITFVIVALLLIVAHRRNVNTPHVRTELRTSYDQLRELLPRLKVGSRVLFLNDPFKTDEWTPLFILRLLHRDQSLQVHRVKMMEAPPSLSVIASYDVVIDWKENQYLRR